MKFAETLTASTKIFATFLFQILGTSAQAQENPIDCEILIYMAAEFPSELCPKVGDGLRQAAI